MFTLFRRHRVGRIVAISVVALLLIAAASPIVVTAVFSSRLTRYVESDSFRAELEKQTANGLHFPKRKLRADQAERDVDSGERG